MKLIYCLGVSFLAALSACGRFRVGTELAGKYENALGHFQVAMLDTLRRKD